MILKWSILITLAVAVRADPDGLVLQNYVLSDNFIEGKDGFILPDLHIFAHIVQVLPLQYLSFINVAY